MTVEMIKTFITLAETRSFSRTADILFVSQPTVSVRLKAMEDELKFPLFVRSNKQVELTPMGLQFFPYAMQMFRSMAACQDFIRGYESQMKRLTIWRTDVASNHTVHYRRKNRINTCLFLNHHLFFTSMTSTCL